MSELFPACFSSSNNRNLSQSSFGSDDKNIVFETPEAETIEPGDLNNFISVLTRVDFCLQLLNQNALPLQNHTTVCYLLN